MSETIRRPELDSSTTVLLVENEAIIRLDLATELEENGFSVIEAQDGRTALKACLAERIDALVVDVDLPGDLSGFDLITAVRQRRPDCPVIMLTERSVRFPPLFDQHVITEAKPFPPEKILLVLRAVAGGGRSGPDGVG